MPIRFFCPLGHKLIVPNHRAGKKGRCPICRQKTIVPILEPPSLTEQHASTISREQLSTQPGPPTKEKSRRPRRSSRGKKRGVPLRPAWQEATLQPAPPEASQAPSPPASPSEPRPAVDPAILTAASPKLEPTAPTTPRAPSGAAASPGVPVLIKPPLVKPAEPAHADARIAPPPHDPGRVTLIPVVDLPLDIEALAQRYTQPDASSPPSAIDFSSTTAPSTVRSSPPPLPNVIDFSPSAAPATVDSPPPLPPAVISAAPPPLPHAAASSVSSATTPEAAGRRTRLPIVAESTARPLASSMVTLPITSPVTTSEPVPREPERLKGLFSPPPPREPRSTQVPPPTQLPTRSTASPNTAATNTAATNTAATNAAATARASSALPSPWMSVTDRSRQAPWLIHVPSGSSLAGLRSDSEALQTSYWLAVVLAMVTFCNFAPNINHLNIPRAPGWSQLLLVMVTLQAFFVIWLASLPDWSTLWAGMLLFAVLAAIYAVGAAMMLATPASDPLILGLGAVRRTALGWCAANVLLMGLVSYGCGRTSKSWQRKARQAAFRATRAA